MPEKPINLKEKQLHNFQRSLLYEREQMERADTFYYKKLNVDKVIRYNSDNKEDMCWQHADIDASIILQNKTFHVSEKFRDRLWNDLLIELYSNYPDVLGWAYTGTPDLLTYFFPEEVYILREEYLKPFALQLFKAIPQAVIEDFYQSKQPQKKISIQLADSCHVTLIAAPNEGYTTISVAVSFAVLDANGVKYKKFDRL